MRGETRYLLDTNAISEPYKRRPNPTVLSFFAALPPSSLYLSVMTLGELRKGAAVKERTEPELARKYSLWIDELERDFGDRIVNVNGAIGALWGKLSAGPTRPIVDTLLAATAIVHDLTLVTRNTKDVAGLPVKLLNPWEPVS